MVRLTCSVVAESSVALADGLDVAPQAQDDLVEPGGHLGEFILAVDLGGLGQVPLGQG